MKIGEWGKNKIIIAVVVALILLIGLVVFLRQDNGPQFFGEDKTIQSTEPLGNEIAVTGTLECLPYKPDSTALDEACVVGLRGDDGKMYALNAPEAFDGEAGDKARVVGKYTAANTVSEEAIVFTYDGVLDVRVFKKI